MKLIQHNYGKARVRVLKVMRAGKTHSVKELDVQVMLQGGFDASFTKADNRLVVATDSIKNTINVFARKELGPETEPFGLALAGHFLKAYAHVSRVEVNLTEHCVEPDCPSRQTASAFVRGSRPGPAVCAGCVCAQRRRN